MARGGSQKHREKLGGRKRPDEYWIERQNQLVDTIWRQDAMLGVRNRIIQRLGEHLTDEERSALIEHDHCKLFELGAHPFLTLTLFIAMFERDHGPLEYQIAYGKAMEHLTLPYPDIAT